LKISQFLYLTTIGWKSGKQHRIEIWFVEYNGRHYVISERHNHAHWAFFKQISKLVFFLEDFPY
jgi:hypothetical protein